MKTEKKKKIPNYTYQKTKSASPMRKIRKLPNTSIEDETCFMDVLTQANDDESVNETQISVYRKPEEHRTSNIELTFVRTMNLEEIHNHIQKCLEMSSENKITPKNAFALQLIDCMNLLLQKEDFSVMACTLDAGQKIYAYRVDGLHHQVIKLAEEVIKNQTQRKMTENGDGDINEKSKKENRKEAKKNILASSESLRRTLRSKDPKEKYIKIDGLPGAITTSVKRDPEDLSLTLQNSVRFWNNLENYKPLTVTGSVTIPPCEIYRDKNETRKTENLLRVSPMQENKEIGINNMFNPSDISSDEVDELFEDDISVEIEDDDDSKSIQGEVDVISNAIIRLNEEAKENKDICTVHSRCETMKMIFNQASDYHYLNMDNAYYWAGPEFWKRQKVTLPAYADKKKVTRKKKDPNSISYTGPEVDENINKILKKGSALNKKTIMGWKMKNVTYARDLKINVKQFLDLYHMSGFFELTESSQSSEEDLNLSGLESNCNNDDILEDDLTTDSSNSQDPLNSCFYENAPENSSNPEDRDPLNSAFYDAGLAHNPTTVSETGKIVKVHFSGTPNNDTSLVPAPKIINYQPIKYKTRPIRVDMQHLKQTMWMLINESNDQNELGESEDPWISLEPASDIKFSNVLKELPHKLEKRTAEDLSPGMALLALLTLANENNLQLKNSDESNDIVISLEDTN